MNITLTNLDLNNEMEQQAMQTLMGGCYLIPQVHCHGHHSNKTHIQRKRMRFNRCTRIHEFKKGR